MGKLACFIDVTLTIFAYTRFSYNSLDHPPLRFTDDSTKSAAITIFNYICMGFAYFRRTFAPSTQLSRGNAIFPKNPPYKKK